MCRGGKWKWLMNRSGTTNSPKTHTYDSHLYIKIQFKGVDRMQQCSPLIVSVHPTPRCHRVEHVWFSECSYRGSHTSDALVRALAHGCLPEFGNHMKQSAICNGIVLTMSSSTTNYHYFRCCCFWFCRLFARWQSGLNVVRSYTIHLRTMVSVLYSENQ